MMLASGQHDLRAQQRRRRRDGDRRAAVEACLPVRQQRIGKELEIRAVAEREGLRLCRVVGVHRVHLGRRLGRDVRARTGRERDFERHAIALQHAASSGDHEQPRHVRQRLVAMQRALREVGRARFQVGQDRAPAPAFEAKTQEAGFAHRTAAHLRRFVNIRRESRGHPRLTLRRRGGCEPRRFLDHAHQAGCLVGTLRSNSRSSTIRSTSAGMPSPVRQLVNRKGLSPRMIFESCSITSRLAPT